MRYCPQCGVGTPDEAKFCGTCGYTLVPSAAQPAGTAIADYGTTSSGTQRTAAQRPSTAKTLIMARAADFDLPSEPGLRGTSVADRQSAPGALPPSSGTQAAARLRPSAQTLVGMAAVELPGDDRSESASGGHSAPQTTAPMHQMPAPDAPARFAAYEDVAARERAAETPNVLPHAEWLHGRAPDAMHDDVSSMLHSRRRAAATQIYPATPALTPPSANDSERDARVAPPLASDSRRQAPHSAATTSFGEMGARTTTTDGARRPAPPTILGEGAPKGQPFRAAAATISTTRDSAEVAKSRASASTKTWLGFAAAPASPPDVGRRSGLPAVRRTLLGVPVPSLVARAVEPAETRYVEEFYDEVVPETGRIERRVRRVPVPPPPLLHRPWFWASLGAFVIIAGGVAAVVLLPSSAPLRAEARVDDKGHDVLHVVCKACPDGTRIAAPGASAVTIQNNEIDVPLAAPLRVGGNTLPLDIDRPGRGRDETVALDVPVAYRVWPDLAALQEASPAIAVIVETSPGSTATVQGRPVALDASGRGKTMIDVRAQLLGQDAETHTLERTITYAVWPKGAKPGAGSLAVRVGVTPLVIDAPGLRLVTDAPTFLLAGRTSKGAELLAAGKPITLHPDGTFSQFMSISAEGTSDVEVRAVAPPLAPRVASVNVTRVRSLNDEARARDAQARAGYSEVSGDLDAAIGRPIAWKAEVVDTASQGQRTIAVIDVQTGCTHAPCLARALLPGPTPAARGTRIGVYGRIAAAASLQGGRVPEIAVEFFVKTP